MAKIIDYYNREIESRPKTKAALFFCIVAVNIIFLGYFGIFKGTQSFNDKRKLVPEYKKVIDGMAYNLDRIDILAGYVSREQGVSVLNDSITDEYEISDYLNQFVFAANESEFTVDKFEPTINSETSSVEISATLSGDEGNFANLITNIENLSRLTSLKEVAYTKQESREGVFVGISVVLTMEIYTL